MGTYNVEIGFVNIDANTPEEAVAYVRKMVQDRAQEVMVIVGNDITDEEVGEFWLDGGR